MAQLNTYNPIYRNDNITEINGIGNMIFQPINCSFMLITKSQAIK